MRFYALVYKYYVFISCIFDMPQIDIKYNEPQITGLSVSNEH